MIEIKMEETVLLAQLFLSFLSLVYNILNFIFAALFQPALLLASHCQHFSQASYFSNRISTFSHFCSAKIDQSQ